MSSRKKNQGRKTTDFTILSARVVVTVMTPKGETTQLVGPGGETFDRLRTDLEAKGCTIVNVVPAPSDRWQPTPIQVSGMFMDEVITANQDACDNCEAKVAFLTRIRVPNADLVCPCDACGRILVCQACFNSRDRGRHIRAAGTYQGVKYRPEVAAA